MLIRSLTTTIATVLIAAAQLSHAAAQTSRGSLPIDLEVAIERGAPGHLVPEWAKLLTDIGLSNPRLRTARSSDEPKVEAYDSAGAKRYRVVALLDSRNRLVLPNRATFTQRERAKLRAYLENLPTQIEEAGVERGRFGLTKTDFQRLFNELSRPTTHPTKGVKPLQAVAQLTAAIATPIQYDAGADRLLQKAQPLTQELKGFSHGTVLAAALREAGLAFVPKQAGSEPMQIRVAPLERLPEWWPVGWRPQRVGREVAPAMHQSKEIEIAGYKLDAALSALQRPLGVPIVYDQRILERKKIDPATIDVKLPRRRSMIRTAVNRILSQGSLAGELRVDEAGRPFYWVTQYGKDSPRATK